MRRKSLAEEYPELMCQWHTSNLLSPKEVSSGSHKKVMWICKKGHTWEAVVKNRALLGSGCPYCEHRAVLKGYNDLQTMFPEVAATWSQNNKLKPTEVSSRSNTEALWKCSKGHEWKARVADRTEGHGCPYCAGQRVWKGFNDLATTHPWLLNEWSDNNKNLSPKEITFKNRSNVWWHCSKCGNEYQAVVFARANGRVCPFCIAKVIKRLREERLAAKEIAKDFEYLLPQLATIYYAGQKGLQVIIDTDNPIGIPVTAHIPNLNLIIDVCDSDKEKHVKELVCRVNGIRYISMPARLPEEESINRVRQAFSVAHIHFNPDLTMDLEIIRSHYFQHRKK